MRQFSATRIQRLSPEEYRRQAETLVPLRSKHHVSIAASGLALALTMERPDIEPLPVLNEGSRLIPIQNVWGALGPIYKRFYSNHFGAEFDDRDTAYYLQRVDTRMQSQSFKWSQDYVSGIGIVTSEGSIHLVSGISLGQLATVRACLEGLASARKEHNLTMLDPVTLEEAWSVPNAPSDWKPLGW